jgi:hypothetical protein
VIAGDAAGADPDFFVSYTGVDERWAVWIAWVLEAAGYRVVVQAWDFPAGSGFVEGMHRATRSAARTVAVLSAAYLGSVFGAAEWQAAWAADPLGRAGKLLPFRVEDCDRPGLLGQIVSVDLFGIDRPTAVERVLSAAEAKRGKPVVEPPFPGGGAGVGPVFPPDLPVMVGVPARLARFVGREVLLAELEGRLSVGGPVAVTALAGMGGVGKTALVVEYIHRHAESLERVGWVPADQPELLGGFLAGLAPLVGLSVEAEPAAVVAGWARLPGSLLIFDNVDDPAAVALIKSLRPSPGAGRLIVTSRQQGWKALGAAVTVPLLPRAEAVGMLTDRFPEIDGAVADRICDLLGDLPLAVEQAAGYLDQTGIPPDEYADLLAEALPDMLGAGEVTDRPGVTVETLWDLSVRRLRVEAPAAVELLELWALCDPEKIPLGLFADASVFDDGPLKDAAGNRVRWAATVGVLVGYSLARRDQDMVDVHRLIQAATRQGMDEVARSARAGTLLRLFRAVLPGEIIRSPAAWPVWRDHLPHIVAVLGQVDDGLMVGELSWLCDRTATYLQEQAQPSVALPLFERALAIAEAVYGPEHPVVSTGLNNLALALRDLGRAGEALPLFRRALAIAEAVYGPEHPVVSTRLNNLAGALRALGRAGEALPLLERALAIDEAVYGPDHPHALTIRRKSWFG